LKKEKEKEKKRTYVFAILFIDEIY